MVQRNLRFEMIGETLRHYRIEAKLGAGGMGVVYRGLDTHLDRAVAIKVLPAGVMGSQDRRARFVQEAKSASALSHRNIITIYAIDTGEVGGLPVDFIAMEYVAGKTLDRLIGRKGLRLNDVLRYAVQIADGLAAAHEAGIVHRDLKPANIMVSEQGEVKILDFGLAKLTEAEEPDRYAETQSMHVEAALKTEVGTILGTVAYMSPEQADGHNVDARSDIFSFGAVLYEMVAGRRAFAGGSKLSTLASVLHTEPAPLSQSGNAIPRELDRVIARCLRKDPQQRWQSMADVKVALEDVREDLESGKVPADGTSVAAPSRRFLPLLVWAILIAAALAGGTLIGWRELRPSQPAFERLTYRRGDVATAKFSPDGQTVFFSAQWANEPPAIFSMRPGSRESRALDLPAARILSISSAGEMAILLGVGVNATSGTLARVPISGGAPREILENVNDADWSPDGSNLAVSRTVGGQNRIEYPIGTIRYENDSRPPLSVRVSPKGDQIAFLEYENAVGDYAVALLDTKGRKRILSRGWKMASNLNWSRAGNELWFGGAKPDGDAALHAVSLSGKERVVAEAPAWMAMDDITRNGSVLVTVVDSRVGIEALAPGAKQERDLSWFDASSISDISADGETILFVESSYGTDRNPAIYLRHTDGSPAVRLGDGNRPVLSPDGKWVACISNKGSKTDLTLLPTGPGEARSIGAAGLHYERVEWLPDGRRLLVTGNEPGKPSRTFVQNVIGGKPAPITPEGVLAAHVSPDGKYVTAVVNGKLNMFTIIGGSPRTIAGLEPGESVIRWSGDGRFLFLRKSEEPFALKIERLDLASGRKEFWRELKTADPVGVNIGPIVMTPDGGAYAYSFRRDISTLYLAKGLK
jgi:eukaryotic-like serine/threonine-protein kinase